MYSVGHPDEDVLERYAMGNLPGPEVDSLEEHVLICEACQGRVEATENYVRSMRVALGNLEQRRARKPWARWFALPAAGWAAAAFAVLLAGLALMRFAGAGGNPVAVLLTATRGEMVSIPATKTLELALDAKGLEPSASYRLEMVDAEGKRIWDLPAAPVRDGQIHAVVNKRLGVGQYFVRAFGATGTPREYALEVHK